MRSHAPMPRFLFFLVEVWVKLLSWCREKWNLNLDELRLEWHLEGPHFDTVKSPQKWIYLFMLLYQWSDMWKKWLIIHFMFWWQIISDPLITDKIQKCYHQSMLIQVQCLSTLSISVLSVHYHQSICQCLSIMYIMYISFIMCIHVYLSKIIPWLNHQGSMPQVVDRWWSRLQCRGQWFGSAGTLGEADETLQDRLHWASAGGKHCGWDWLYSNSELAGEHPPVIYNIAMEKHHFNR